RELDRLLARCGKDDLVLLAFAGHGIQPKAANEFFFCPYQAKLDDAATLLSLDEVFTKLGKCPAGCKVLLADACRNDPGTRGPRPVVTDLPSVTIPQNSTPPAGVIAFYSCSAGEYAYEPADLKHGLFFYFVIDGLKGKADWDNDGKITREELEHYVKK